MLLPYMCWQQICPSNVTYIIHANYFMYINNRSMKIKMPNINSLASAIVPGALYTDDNDDDPNDNAA